MVETVLELASHTDVYVGVLPRRRRGGGRADLVEAASVVWVDCETSSSVAALRRFRPAPGMIVASGSGQNCHAYWLLEESVELDAIERVNRRLALTLGADGGGRADVIERAAVVWADCDTGGSVGALRAFRPMPAMVVASSEGKRHAYWFLTEPVSVDLVAVTNRRIGLALGADVVCSERARILRPFGVCE